MIAIIELAQSERSAATRGARQSASGKKAVGDTLGIISRPLDLFSWPTTFARHFPRSTANNGDRTMPAPLRSYSTTLFLLVLGIIGCGQPVREDRSINWSQDGRAVGFQHGAEGVFVAGKDGRKLTKIYQPGPEILAASTPLWSPDGRYAIFTTARDEGEPPKVTVRWGAGNADPAGNIHTQRPIRYTCWLYEKSDEKLLPAPTALFEAACDHVGYVAANLAVRWHPRGKHVFHVEQIAPNQHALFAYDLATHKSSQVFPHASEALIFDWTPDGSHLVCVLGSRRPTDTDGIWIGQPDADDWWHVPDSSDLAYAELPSVLEALRATQPAWTPDSRRFAFTSYIPSPNKEQTGKATLRLGNLATRTVEVLAETTAPLRDLHWTPDGRRLGMVQAPGSLHVLVPGTPLSPAINRRPVRRFAGWNGAGNRLAYVAADPIPHASGETWAFLFVPDERARDAVFVADGAGSEPGHEVFSGLRVTFPQWSPREEKLSLWGTFTPPYRSLVSVLLGWGLRPGDPAAILDMKTGRLDWMAVSPHEKVQVGHYYLLKRDYAEAWRWYADAERELPPPRPPTVQQFLGRLANAVPPENFSLFQWYCLSKLGRTAQAKGKLDEFHRTFLPKRDAIAKSEDSGFDLRSAGAGVERIVQEVLDEQGLLAPLLRDLYAAEVILSLDAVGDGEAFFRKEMTEAQTDGARLSSAIVLSQLLLLEKKYSDYANLMTVQVLPLLPSYFEPKKGAPDTGWPELAAPIQFFLLLPLFSPDFQSLLSEKQVEALLARWNALRGKIHAESTGLSLDLVLRAAYTRTQRTKEAQAVDERVKQTALALKLPVSADDIAKGIAEMRKEMRQMLGY
jgi:WD40-like Beta Propeller Repeat